MIHQAKVHGHFINGIRAESNLLPKIALAELIDNSLDSGAQTVEITFDVERKITRIKDDGRGCDDLHRFFEIGSSSASDSLNRIGRYGVGGTKAAALLCDIEEVHTHHNGVHRTGRMEWTRLADENADLVFEVNDEPRYTRQTGTEIILIGDRRDVHDKRRAGACLNYWSKIYTPALMAGKAIIFNGQHIEPKPFPKLRSRMEIVGNVDGKQYRATVGIIASEVEAKSLDWEVGFNVACAGRLLFERPEWDGADDFVGAPIWAYIELVETAESRWHLDTHKTGFAERAELFADFVPQISDLLTAAMDNRSDHEIRVISEELSTTLAAAFGGTSAFSRIRERRASPINKSGTVEAKDTGRQRSKADKVDPTKPGSVIEFPNPNARKNQTWSVQFAEMGADAGIGAAYVRPSAASMKFNLSNEWVSLNRNRLEVLIPIAVQSIWLEGNDKDQDRLWSGLGLTGLALDEPSVSKRMSQWLGAALEKIEANRGEVKKAVKEIRKQQKA